MAQLRDYQTACHDAVLSSWGERPWRQTTGDTYRSVLANLTTSAGKTVIAGAIIDSVKDRAPCLFVADTDELCKQPEDKFRKHFQIETQLEKAGSRASSAARVVIASAQTLSREDRLKEWDPKHFGYIFVDEAHRGSDRNKRITDYFVNAKVMGMTATAFRAKRADKSGLADLSDYYDHVAFEMGMFDLIGEGYVSPIKVLTLPVNVDIRAVHHKGEGYDNEELDESIRPYYEEICNLLIEHVPNRQIVAYLPLRKSSQEFAKIAGDFGIAAEHVQGDSPDRERIQRDFESKKIQLISNSSLLTTGWDCPPCDCLLNLAPTRSAGLFRQKVGRIGRVLPGIIDGLTNKEDRLLAIANSSKPDALILDLLWQTEKFGLQTAADLIAGNEEERKAIQAKMAGLRDATDLEAITAKVQEEREKALKRALDESARRQSGMTDAVNYVAAVLHGRKVTDYEPTMKWESQEPSDKQKRWLERQGIDPKTAKDRGHVAAFMNLLFSRDRLGLCSWLCVKVLEEMGFAGATRCTSETAYEVLGGSYPVGFGRKYKGKSLKSVPYEYWEWCVKSSAEPGQNQGWFEKHAIEYRHAQSILNPDGSQCTCIGSHKAPNCTVHPREIEKVDVTGLDWGREPDPKSKTPRVH